MKLLLYLFYVFKSLGKKNKEDYLTIYLILFFLIYKRINCVNIILQILKQKCLLFKIINRA